MHAYVYSLYTFVFWGMWMLDVSAHKSLSLQAASLLRLCSQEVSRMKKTKISCHSKRMTCSWWKTQGRTTCGRAPCSPQETTAWCQSTPCSHYPTPSISESVCVPGPLQLQISWLRNSRIKCSLVKTLAEWMEQYYKWWTFVRITEHIFVKLFFLFGQVVPEEVPRLCWMLTNRKWTLCTSIW